ncbi:hypothetical protein AVEN_22702-1 [Araneus ventricosus]|uniref:Uncharacterized protein n=1 Tax=Araneus ventricosus TaxID=182803 RepID=A0A4Y2SR90_ARAVE|nr:hypothetical protein AVEN_80171-1 [Araneus ventricosus]GBN90868.1 hypothetical protein AVEN_22702-1 [Araneus ventricosus]
MDLVQFNLNSGSVGTQKLLFGTDLVILNHGQMTWMTAMLGTPSLRFCTTPVGGHMTHAKFGLYYAHRHGRSSVESGFEPRTLQSQDLITKTLRENKFIIFIFWMYS